MFHKATTAQTQDEAARSSATELTGVGSEVLLHGEGTSIGILVEESGQREKNEMTALKHVTNLICILECTL